MKQLTLQESLAVIDTAYDHVKQGWCQGAMARNAEGRMVEVDNPEAASFCLIGSMFKACHVLEFPLPMDDYVVEGHVRTALYHAIAGSKALTLIEYNDRSDTTKARILATLQRAHSYLASLARKE